MEYKPTTFMILTTDGKQFIGESDYSFDKILAELDNCISKNEVMHFESVQSITRTLNGNRQPSPQTCAIGFNPAHIVAIYTITSKGD